MVHGVDHTSCESGSTLGLRHTLRITHEIESRVRLSLLGIFIGGSSQLHDAVLESSLTSAASGRVLVPLSAFIAFRFNEFDRPASYGVLETLSSRTSTDCDFVNVLSLQSTISHSFNHCRLTYTVRSGLIYVTRAPTTTDGPLYTFTPHPILTMNHNEISAAIVFGIFLVVCTSLACIIFACEWHRRKRMKMDVGHRVAGTRARSHPTHGQSGNMWWELRASRRSSLAVKS